MAHARVAEPLRVMLAPEGEITHQPRRCLPFGHAGSGVADEVVEVAVASVGDLLKVRACGPAGWRGVRSCCRWRRGWCGSLTRWSWWGRCRRAVFRALRSVEWIS